jgi:hypothetical protein
MDKKEVANIVEWIQLAQNKVQRNLTKVIEYLSDYQFPNEKCASWSQFSVNCLFQAGSQSTSVHCKLFIYSCKFK